MTKKKFGTKSIALMGVLIAVVVVFSRFFAYETTFLKISFTFIPESLIGMIFGPFWAGIGTAVADVVGSCFFQRQAIFLGLL